MKKILLLLSLVICSVTCFAQIGSTVAVTIGPNNTIEDVNLLTIDSIVVTIPGSGGSEASILMPNSANFFAPTITWNNGLTYFAIQKDINATPFGQAGIIVYNEDKGIDRPQFVGKILNSSDTHTVPVISLSDSSIYVFQENLHISPLDIYKDSYLNDYADFIELAENVGTEIAYTQLIPFGNNYKIFYRFGAGYRIDVISSSTGLEGWGSTQQITVNAPGGNRYYPTTPNNNNVNTWYHHEITLRIEIGNEWSIKYKLKTQDYITWYNEPETFSKNVVVLGALTSAELGSNFLYLNGTTTINYYPPVSCVTPQGKYITITGDGVGGYNLMHYAGGWQSVPVTGISNILDNSAVTGDPLSQGGGILQIYGYGSNVLEILVRVQDGAFIKVHRYRSTNLGNTWTFVDNPFESINEDIWIAYLPFNIASIPVNRNSIIIGGQYETTGRIPLYIKRIAFGTIQPEPNIITPPVITSYTDVANCEVAYEIATGKITNTGTTLTSLLDQSGNGRTGTPSGSPVVNNAVTPTELIFDGVNDLISVPSTGLTGLTQATAVFVFKSSATPVLMAFSNNTVTNQWLTFQGNLSNGSSRLRYVKGASVDFSIIGQDIINDGNYHIASFVAGNNKYYLYIDGVLQYIGALDLTGAERVNANWNGFISTMTGINRIDIGALVRTTTSFTALTLKSLGLYSRCLSNNERLGLEIMLSNQYGITLGNQFN